MNCELIVVSVSISDWKLCIHINASMGSLVSCLLSDAAFLWRGCSHFPIDHHSLAVLLSSNKLTQSNSLFLIFFASRLVCLNTVHHLRSVLLSFLMPTNLSCSLVIVVTFVSFNVLILFSFGFMVLF